mmetsp:Transcript_35811/g.102987  ORF Transcript_35811/g.102987 Transcript_35811/m.102987 type:complete len:248 (-) Transcript_35811:1185-1928(-)
MAGRPGPVHSPACPACSQIRSRRQRMSGCPCPSGRTSGRPPADRRPCRPWRHRNRRNQIQHDHSQVAQWLVRCVAAAAAERPTSAGGRLQPPAACPSGWRRGRCPAGSSRTWCPADCSTRFGCPEPQRVPGHGRRPSWPGGCSGCGTSRRRWSAGSSRFAGMAVQSLPGPAAAGTAPAAAGRKGAYRTSSPAAQSRRPACPSGASTRHRPYPAVGLSATAGTAAASCAVGRRRPAGPVGAAAGRTAA